MSRLAVGGQGHAITEIASSQPAAAGRLAMSRSDPKKEDAGQTAVVIGLFGFGVVFLTPFLRHSSLGVTGKNEEKKVRKKGAGANGTDLSVTHFAAIGYALLAGVLSEDRAVWGGV